MDNLKKWAAENRDKTDIYETDLDSLWSGIETGLDERKPGRFSGMWVTMKWAATIVIPLFLGMYFYTQRHEQPAEGYALYQVSPELADTEYYYRTQLGEKMEMVKSSGAEIDPSIFKDLDQLDSIYKDLMMDLKDKADNEEVVQAMIENYRIRVQILERILEQINDKNEKENDDERAI